MSLLLRRVGIEDSERSGCIYCARIETAAALVNRPGLGFFLRSLIIDPPDCPPLPSTSCPVPAKNRVGERLSGPSAITSMRIDLGMVLADISASVEGQRTTDNRTPK
jgi:hypothetical protein